MLKAGGWSLESRSDQVEVESVEAPKVPQAGCW